MANVILEMALVLSFVVSFLIGIKSFINPFWIFHSLGKRNMKRLVIFSFFAFITFGILGILFNPFFSVLVTPFFTIFLVQILIDSVYYFSGDTRFRMISFFQQYVVFVFLIRILVNIAVLVARILRRG